MMMMMMMISPNVNVLRRLKFELSYNAVQYVNHFASSTPLDSSKYIYIAKT